MAVEEGQKSPLPTSEETANLKTQDYVNDDEAEEGEIVDDQESSSKKSSAVAYQPHLLEHQWTFWFDNPSSKSSVYNNIHHPSKLAIGADFHCFKYKIEPKWEDPVCANGGKWTVVCPKGKSDTSWLYTLLAMIGEQFDHGDEICGAVVNVRAKQEKIALWTKNASNEAAQLSIGKQWKEFLDYNETIGFIFHDDAKKLDKAAKNRYTI